MSGVAIEAPVQLNLKEVLSPIGQERPCGENVRLTPHFQEKYYRLKDARNAARGVERSIVPGENLRIATAWHEVNDLAVQILASDSKDLEVLTWLAEAQLRMRGFEGLRDVFGATASLLDNYWDEINSIGDGDLEEKIAPLAGLNGVNGEGSLIQAIRLAPLVPGAAFAQHSFWDYQLAQRANEGQRREALYEAAGEAGSAAMTAHLGTVNGCAASFGELSTILATRCGELAPPSSNTRNVLREVASAIRDIAGIGDGATVTVGAADEDKPANSLDVAAPAMPVQPGKIGSREEGFELLLSVARYFRRTEPHSPISLAIETLVRRGRMDFSELLGELLPDANIRNSVLTAAGIKTKTEK